MSKEIHVIEKKELIIKAALKEFTEKGYGNASTNMIVEDAGVSKGVLFYHFGDKEGLFNYLVEYTVDILTEDIVDRVNLENPDFFDFLHESVSVKLLTMTKYPLESQFYANAYNTDIPDSTRVLLDEHVTRSIKIMSDAYQYFDASLLKDGMEVDMVMKMIEWASKGMIDDVIANENLEYDLENYERLTETIDENFNFLKKLFYKDSEEGK